MTATERKRRAATWLANHVVNPPIRTLFRLGLPIPGTVILETTGRASGRPRRTPVTDGRDGDVFWIVAEHGRQAGYVKNLLAHPRVRIKVGRRWLTGTARIAEGEDPRQRLAVLRRRAATRLNARTIVVMSTELLVIRVDLDRPG